MRARLHVDQPLRESGQCLDLPPGAARHVQVLRAQPGERLALFDGLSDLEWQAEVTAMGRSAVAVRLLEARTVASELPLAVTLAVVMPANDRMDFLVEKATELGASALQPLMSERSVLRLSGERADRKRAHWQGVAVAAAEQCGRVRLPLIQPVLPLASWLARAHEGLCWLASPSAEQPPRAPQPTLNPSLTLLSGPEGGLSEAEEAAAVAAGFQRIGLGPRILRADTAPLALLAWLSLSGTG
jgi:16S rRNA (uracil1498-N3)-methyltransferase